MKKKNKVNSFDKNWEKIIIFSKRLFAFSKIVAGHIWYWIMFFKYFCISILGLYDDLFPGTRHLLQICSMYLFALIDLIYVTVRFIYQLGGTLPPFLRSIQPFTVVILENPILQTLFDPLVTILSSFLVFDLFLLRNVFKLNKLVRFNIVLIYSLITLQQISMLLWDVIFNSALPETVAAYAWAPQYMTVSDVPVALVFFTITLIVFLFTYSYCFSCAFLGRFPIFPKGFFWITDSAAFWMRIKTPTMPYGKRGKKRK